MTQVLKQNCLVRIVDDDPDIRDALTFMLSCKGWRVACYDCAQGFLTDYRAAHPGCVLLDIRMPGMSGVELQRTLKERGQIALPIIFITGHADVTTAVDTLRMGAFDFLQKPVDGDRLNESIEAACRISLAQQSGRLNPEDVNEVFSSLTPREKEVARLLTQGVTTNREIAERMALSERTVQGYRNTVYHRLRVHNYQEFVQQIKGADIGLLAGNFGS